MYKTTVYKLINGRITHQKQKTSEKGDTRQHDSLFLSQNYLFFIVA